MNSAQALERALGRTGIPAESVTAKAFLAHLALLEKWNARINLTASTAWDSIGPLYEEAIWAASKYPVCDSAHLDIGSGAGFPAIPMRILLPKMRLHLIESRAKRAAFLETVVRELALEGVRVINDRLGRYVRSREQQGAWDSISWKAVRLSPGEISLLMEHSGHHTRFWVFHGQDLPVEDSLAWERSMTRIVREPCPARKGWFLSIYAKNSA